MYRAILRSSNKNALQKTTSNYKYYSSKNIPVRQAGFGKFIIFVTPIVATGGVITYAKYDNEFRKTVVDSVPGADYIIKVALREEKPFENLVKRVDELYSSIADLFGPAQPVKKEQSPKVDQQRSFKSGDLLSKGQEKSVPAPAPSPTKPEAEYDKQAKAKPTAATSKPVRDSAPIAISRPSDAIPKDIIELERAVEVAAAAAVQEYDKAIRTLRSYNEDVNKVLDQAIERADLTAWTKLKNKTSARDTAVESAEEAARQATQKIEQCELALSKVANSVSPERLQAVRQKIKLLNEHITGVKDELYRTKDSSELSEKYWRKIERARNYFIDEIESIFPGLNLAEKKLNLPKDDLDLFIMHAYSHVLAYQKELQRLQLTGELKLKRAIEAMHGDNQDHIVKAQLDYYLDKEKRQLAIDNQKRIFQIRAEADKELRTQLKRQAEAHVDHIQDALSTKESELRRSFMRELDEKLSVEKAAYKLQLATMLGKLKGMDAALRARAESEKCAHQAQALWAACQALWASMRTGDPDIHWQQKLRPLQSEIKAVSKAAAKEDELVTVLLQNLPEEARTRGVYPEDALRERFFNVEKVARKVALVPEEGASIPIYLLSYLQSVFVVRPSQPISKDELQDKKIDFSTLDTYDILNRARYCLDRGDLMQALKYMNLLQGAPRKIARDWLKEVRLLLETQQAANTLMAHAAASGLLYL